MDKNTLCESLIKWIQTFKNITAPHNTVEDLADGIAMAQVLAQVVPDWFDPFWLSKIKTDDVNNWRLKVSNLKKILKGIVDYYQEVSDNRLSMLGQQIIGFKLPDLNAIAEHNDTGELGRLLQLILGCAVNCDHKQEYIEIIMGMEESDQHAVMNAIQELMAPTATASGDTVPDVDQLKRLMEDLQAATEAKEGLTQRCHELDLQVALLQEDKVTLHTENEKLTQKVAQLEGLDDLSTAAGRKSQQLQHQVEHLQEELYKLETSRDEYRVKVEELEKSTTDLQAKNEELQKVAEEARILKDEIDVLRETADKAAKYESTIEMYKKKLEDMGDLRRQVKLLEEKNVQYMQSNMELEEELKKGGSLKSHIEIYKKQVQELHNKLSDETKKADKAEFENKKHQEKLNALQRERERLIAERDTLKETNEELRLTQLQIESANMSPKKSSQPGSMSDSEMLETIPPEVKERLIRLQHENKMLKLNRQGSDEEQLQVVQSMLDDARQRESEMQTENRLANQRLLELESQLEDLQSSQSDSRNQEGAEVRQKLSSTLAKLKDYESELQKKATILLEFEAQLSERDQRIQTLQDSLNKKEDEMKRMEERYKKYLEKAKSVIQSLDPKQHAGAPPEILILRNQLQEKNKLIENLEKDSEKSRAVRDMEERLMTSAFYSLTKQLHRKVAEERLSHVNAGQTFLARQRQATSRKLGLGIAQSEFLID